MKNKILHIEEFLNNNKGDGYGYALINPEGIVVTPYIDSSDYPDLFLNENGQGIGLYEGWRVYAHSGILEQNPYFFYTED